VIDSNDSLKIRDAEKILGYREWVDKVPFIEFPEGWAISVIPPFAGAMCRFRARVNDKEYSVYLDCHDLLGGVGSPYWEAYPIQNDVARFDINDVNGLIKCISEEAVK
jgi:hypothetical protein